MGRLFFNALLRRVRGRAFLCFEAMGRCGRLEGLMNPKLKARVIAEWRGLPEEPFVQDTSKPVSEALQKLIGQLGIQQRVNQEEIVAVWKEVVGDFISRHAAPARLVDGLLVVHVLQPTVHFELERVWKRVLLEKLQTRFGRRMVREIRFRLG